jgi:hypothetical protein
MSGLLILAVAVKHRLLTASAVLINPGRLVFLTAVVRK